MALEERLREWEARGKSEPELKCLLNGLQRLVQQGTVEEIVAAFFEVRSSDAVVNTDVFYDFVDEMVKLAANDDGRIRIGIVIGLLSHLVDSELNPGDVFDRRLVEIMKRRFADPRTRSVVEESYEDSRETLGDQICRLGL